MLPSLKRRMEQDLLDEDVDGGENVASKYPSSNKGQTVGPRYIWALNSNSKDKVRSWGFGMGITFDIGSGYKLTGNYNYKNQEIDYAFLFAWKCGPKDRIFFHIHFTF